MHMEYLKEFVAFAQYLNYTRASEELHMTQSNLSKHMKKLEKELGFCLVDCSHKRLSLTDAGTIFLADIQPLLEQFDNTAAKCKRHASSNVFEISVQDPPYNDAAAQVFLRMLNDLKSDDRALMTKFIHFKYQTHRKMLKAGKIDIVLEYRMGDIDEIFEEYQSLGFRCVHLARVPFCIWCDVNSPVNKEGLEMGDLARVPLMTYHDASNPQQYLLHDLCASAGFKPTFNITSANSPAEYYHTVHPQSVFLLPAAYEDDMLFRMRDDMAFVPFRDESVVADVFAIANEDSWCFDAFCRKAAGLPAQD